ncbi:MAG: apolipoprotein N-acyltransferase [Pseudomonadota bacterium]
MTEPVRSHGFTALGPIHESLARLTGWRAHGMAALLGAVGALAFAPFHLTPILIISFCGLIWMMDGARAHKHWGKATFARGVAFGYGYFLVSLYWLVFPFLVEPEKHAVFLFMPLIMMPLGMGCITGFGMLLSATFWSSSPSRIPVFAIGLTIAEFLRGYLFGGFPWNIPGTSWAPGGAISQLAALGGVYWLTLLTILAMAAPAAFVDTRESKGLALRLVPSIFAVVMIGGAWTYGAQRLSSPTEFTDRGVTLMDSGVPQSEKRDNAGPILNQYLTMLQDYPGDAGEIVVWPEGALPFALLESPRALDAITSFLGDRKLIAGTGRRQFRRRPSEDGTTTFTRDPSDQVYYNSLVVLDSQSSRTGPLAVYDKHRLVPFGELAAEKIVPFGSSFSSILPPALQDQAKAGFEPGPGPDNVYADGVPPFVALICYEGLFPQITRKARPRGDWIVLISNDGWFGYGMGPEQHFAQNAYRAIENGLPMVRVASRGRTAILDGYGRQTSYPETLDAAQNGWKPRILQGKLPRALPETLYRQNGFIFLWLTIAALSVAAFALWRR